MWNFQSPTPIRKYKRHKRNKLWLFQEAGADVPLSSRDNPHDCSPHLPSLPSAQHNQKSQFTLKSDMPQMQVSPWRVHRHKHQGCSWHVLKDRGAPSPSFAAQLVHSRGRHEEGSQCSSRRSEPETNAATDWQWREFYYYPIITLGSEPKWSMLPPWCHFLLSWLETKSGSMGQ